jgi:hypothetical protein
MRKIIRRNIIFSKHFLRCLLWGYVDIKTMENYQPRMLDRRIRDLNDDYEDDDECGYDEPAIGEKDELLDLGVNKPVSLLVAQRNHVSDANGVRKRKEDAFLEECLKVQR